MSDCINSTYKPDKVAGYPRVSARRVFGQSSMTHSRYVYMIAHGRLPRNIHVHHTCENRRCINLEHLEAVEAPAHMTLTGNNRWAGKKGDKCKERGHEPRYVASGAYCMDCARCLQKEKGR